MIPRKPKREVSREELGRLVVAACDWGVAYRPPWWHWRRWFGKRRYLVSRPK